MQDIFKYILFSQIEIQELKEVYSPGYKDPFIILYMGLTILVLSGIYFASLLREKLLDWEADEISPLPLGNTKTLSSWIFAFIGLALIFLGVLQIFDFSLLFSIISALFFTLTAGLVMWKVVKDLMVQVENKTIKEIDDYL